MSKTEVITDIQLKNSIEEMKKEFLRKNGLPDHLWYELTKFQGVVSQQVRVPEKLTKYLEELNTYKIRSRTLTVALRRMRNNGNDKSWLYDQLLKLQKENSKKILNIRGYMKNNREAFNSNKCGDMKYRFDLGY